MDWDNDSICANCSCHSSWHSLSSDKFVKPFTSPCLIFGCKCTGYKRLVPILAAEKKS